MTSSTLTQTVMKEVKQKMKNKRTETDEKII